MFVWTAAATIMVEQFPKTEQVSLIFFRSLLPFSPGLRAKIMLTNPGQVCDNPEA
jgi:hypothetical protein